MIVDIRVDDGIVTRSLIRYVHLCLHRWHRLSGRLSGVIVVLWGYHRRIFRMGDRRCKMPVILLLLMMGHRGKAVLWAHMRRGRVGHHNKAFNGHVLEIMHKHVLKQLVAGLPPASEKLASSALRCVQSAAVPAREHALHARSIHSQCLRMHAEHGLVIVS